MITVTEQPGNSGDINVRPQNTRILHPVRLRDDWARSAPNGEPVQRICVLDCETTGLDVDRHQVIEICAAMVLANRSGNVVGIQSIGSGLINPGQPLDPKIVELTGLTDAALAHTTVDHERLIAFIEHCEGVIAYNAAFDRPFIEKLLPTLRPMPWACAMADVPWRRCGFEPGPQGYLLMQTGRFMPSAHRAQDDVLALTELLAHSCDDGETVMAKTLAAMDAEAWRFEAKEAPFCFKDDLRLQRYRFAGERTHKLWHKQVRPSDYQEELDWYVRTIGQEPAIVPLSATDRYRADRTWRPA